MFPCTNRANASINRLTDCGRGSYSKIGTTRKIFESLHNAPQKSLQQPIFDGTIMRYVNVYAGVTEKMWEENGGYVAICYERRNLQQSSFLGEQRTSTCRFTSSPFLPLSSQERGPGG